MILFGKKNRLLIPLLLLYHTASAFLNPEAAVVIMQAQYKVPVLINKQNNTVLKISIHVPSGSSGIATEGFYFSTSGSTSLRNVKQVRLYYMGSDSVWVNFVRPVKMELFGMVNQLKNKVSIEGKMVLMPGDHYFWLSYELSDAARLSDHISVRLLSVKLGGKSTQVPAAEKQAVQQVGVALRQHGQDGINTYRIPGVTTTKRRTLLATYDARRDRNKDLQGNIDIVLNRSTDGGRTWEPLQVAMDRGEWGGLPQKFNGISDACILNDEKTGTIWIAGLWMYGVITSEGKWVEGLTQESTEWNHQWRDKGSGPGFGVKQTSQFLVVKSTDDGKTFSEPVNLTDMCKKAEWWLWAPAPGHGITLKDGTLVFPTQGRDKTGRPFSNITYSADQGRTWKTSVPADTGSTTESMVTELSDGTLMLNMRANENKRRSGSNNGRAVAVTSNFGKSWTSHSSSRNALQESTCQGSLHKHRYSEDGVQKSVLVFSNPNTKLGRHDMTIKLSFDDGKTWPEKYFTLIDEGNSNGYSCLTSVDEQTIGIVYESSQSDIVFQRFTLMELMNPDKN